MALSKHARLAITGTAIHLGLVSCLFVEFVSYVPGAKRTFDEFGVTLPWLTLVVIRKSNWISEYWWTLVPIVFLFTITQYAVLAFTDKDSNRVGLKVCWIAAIAVLLAAPALATAYAIEAPLLMVREAMAR